MSSSELEVKITLERSVTLGFNFRIGQPRISTHLQQSVLIHHGPPFLPSPDHTTITLYENTKTSDLHHHRISLHRISLSSVSDSLRNTLLLTQKYSSSRSDSPNLTRLQSEIPVTKPCNILATVITNLFQCSLPQ